MLCTYFNEQDFIRYSKVDDEDVNELLQEVREKFPRYYLQEFKFEKRKFLKKIEIIRFSVYIEINGMEVQNLLLPTELISKESVMAFFYGLLNGIEKTR